MAGAGDAEAEIVNTIPDLRELWSYECDGW